MPSAIYGQQPIKLVGVTAQSAIVAAGLFCFVKFVADGVIALCSAVTDVPCGVVQALCNAGDPVEVVAVGETQIQVSASLAAGNLIGTTTAGTAAHYVPGTDTTKYIVGQVTRVAGATGVGNYATAVVNCASPARGA